MAVHGQALAVGSGGDLGHQFRTSSPVSEIDAFLGLDAGKGEHHATAITPAGKKAFDQRLSNGEPKLREVLAKLKTKHGTVLVVVDHRAPIGALSTSATSAASPPPPASPPTRAPPRQPGARAPPSAAMPGDEVERLGCERRLSGTLGEPSSTWVTAAYLLALRAAWVAIPLSTQKEETWKRPSHTTWISPT